jgi:hypothetical protein
VVIIVSFRMSSMCQGQNCQFQLIWYVSWSKLSVSTCLECVVVKIVSFSMSEMECVVVIIVSFSTSGMCCGQNRQFQHVWYASWSQ